MLLLTNINSYNNQYVFLLPSVKNNLISNSLFTRIIYSTPYIAFNGLFLSIPNQSFFYPTTLDTLNSIENNILSIYNCNKKKILHLKQILTYKLQQITNNIIIKISGIWESDTSYGIAYKIIL
jgi:hypothetical protein